MRKHLPAAAFTTLLTAIPLTITSVAVAQDDADGSELRTGEFIWRPELSPSGSMSMVIDLSRQRAYVSRDGVCIGVSTISTGKPGYETPTGEYSVTEKERFHRSNRYDNAPMPYMQRLTNYGLALHGGHLPGYPASHGCVRLPYGFAADLFRESTVGMRVTIREHGHREETSSREASSGDASSGDASSGTAPNGEYGTEDSAPDTHTSEAHTGDAHPGLQSCEIDDSP